MTGSRKLPRRALFVLAALLTASACGGAAAISPSPSPGITFTMEGQNGSAAIGTGLIDKGTGSFTITIKLTGLAPSSSHISHIHAGKCSQPGGIAFALSQVIANSSGAATATTVVPVDYSVPASGWYVNVHHGPDFTEADYAPSDSCGDLAAG
ncbi:MAG TPA: CHRD domain-containing protein [Candidatus Dormibacteraeota bacterium]